MSHNVERMAFVGQVPWWGIGTNLKPGDLVTERYGSGGAVGQFLGAEGTLVSGEEMLKAAGLDFDVRLLPVTSETPNGPVEIPNQFGVFRDDSWAGLGVVGKKYVPVQNRELFGIPDEMVREGTVTYNTAGSLLGGRLVWALADLGSYSIRRAGGWADKSDRYLLWTASHDGQTSVVGGFTDVRVVCNNTLDAAMGYKGSGLTNRVRIRHTASAPERMKEAHRVLLTIQEEGRKFQDVLQGLADTRMNVREMSEFATKWMESTRGKLDTKEDSYEVRAARRDKAVSELSDLFVNGKGNTGSDRYDAYNAVTEWLDHKRAQYDVTKDRNEAQQRKHFASTLSGDRFKRKGQALGLLTK